MKAQLTFLNGERAGEVYTLREGRTVIGRQVGDITLADKEVSSIHAIISYERNAWYVMDLGSTNGVWVNEQLQPEARLGDGVEIRLGQTRLRFNDGGVSDRPEAGVPTSQLEESTVDRGPAAVGIDGRSPFGGAAEQTTEIAPSSRPTTSTDQPVLDEQIEFGATVREAAAETVEPAGLSPFEIVLRIEDGADAGLTYRFSGETILLGRLNTDLVVRDSDVSRRHAIIEVFEDDMVYIRDLGSTNGSFVNGERISTVRLQPGDKIKLGRCTISFDYKITG